jgi:hypothetical protein
MNMEVIIQVDKNVGSNVGDELSKSKDTLVVVGMFSHMRLEEPYRSNGEGIGSTLE